MANDFSTVDSLVHTTTKTESYTDIIVTPSTTTNTAYATTTAWITLHAVATSTSTVVQTSTLTVTAGSTPVKKRDSKKKQKKKKSACRARTSTTSAISEVPTSTNVPATSCTDYEQFSSACSCITAVGDVTVTVAVTDATSTGTVTATEYVSGPASAPTETVVETSTVTQKSTATVFTSTSTKLTTSTTTVTVTTTPTPTLNYTPLIAEEVDGTNWWYVYRDAWGYLTFNTTVGPEIVVEPSGLVHLRDQPSVHLWAYGGAYPSRTSSWVTWMGDDEVDVTERKDRVINCLEGANGYLHCFADGSTHLINWYYCTGYVYLTVNPWPQLTEDCRKVQFRWKPA